MYNINWKSPAYVAKANEGKQFQLRSDFDALFPFVRDGMSKLIKLY